MMSLLCHPPLFNFNLLEELITRTSELDDGKKEINSENETVSENYEYLENTEILVSSVNDINNDDSNNKKDKINDKYVDNKDDKDEMIKGQDMESRLNVINILPITTTTSPSPSSSSSSSSSFSLPIAVPRIPNDDSDSFHDCRHYLALSRPGNTSIILSFLLRYIVLLNFYCVYSFIDYFILLQSLFYCSFLFFMIPLFIIFYFRFNIIAFSNFFNLV
jgi:hypothetical protein